jgi:hypothetical protein
MLTAYQPADAANFMFTSASVEAEDKAQVTAWYKVVLSLCAE